MTASGSNLRIIFLSVIIILLHTGCDRKKNDVIPDVYINFYIDLDDPEFLNLTFITGHALIDATTNNIGSDASGFSGNGIIVYHALQGEFYAYDRTCPHDFVTDGSSVKVNISGIYAICPVCSTRYSLPGFGTPESGPGRFPLKNYRTSFSGQFVHVWNHF